MPFTAILTLLSMFGSLVSGALALAAVFLSVPVFVLRALGLMEAEPRVDLATQQVRISRIRLIGEDLSANQWPPGRPLRPEEAALLLEEMDRLREEEIAAIRAAKERRERASRGWARGWARRGGGMWGRVRSVFTGRSGRPLDPATYDDDDVVVNDLAASFSQLQLPGIPLEPLTGVVPHRSSMDEE